VKNCSSCESLLYTLVPYCPFCGGKVESEALDVVATVNKLDEVAPVAAAEARPTAKRAGSKTKPSPQIDESAVKVATSKSDEGRGNAATQWPFTEQSAPIATQGAKTVTLPVPDAARPPVVPRQTITQVPPKRKWGRVVLSAIVVLAVLAYLGKNPNENDVACNAAFDLGTKAISTGDLVVARNQSLQANASCTGVVRAKAEALQAAITKAEVAGNECLRSFHTIASLLEDHRLTSARTSLDQLGSICSADPSAAGLRQKLTLAQTSANTALQMVRKAIENRDIPTGKQALEVLAGLNSEYPNLAELNAEVEKMAVTETSAAVVESVVQQAPNESTPVPAQVRPSPIVVAAPIESRLPKQETAVNPKGEMAQAFLRDAEISLGQRKFDAARTYLDSARRMDPNNPRIESLSQQIRERERQLLQQDTTIR